MLERLLGIQRNASCDYKFQCLNLEDFELNLRFKPTVIIMKLFLKLAKGNIEKKTGHVDNEKIYEVLDGMVLPDGYNNLIHTSCKPVLKDVFKSVNADGITIIREKVDKVQFFKEGDGWICQVHFIGSYVKK